MFSDPSQLPISAKSDSRSLWFFFGGEMIIASNDPEQQEKIIKYRELITNAVIFRNVVDLSDILLQLKKKVFSGSRNQFYYNGFNYVFPE